MSPIKRSLEETKDFVECGGLVQVSPKRLRGGGGGDGYEDGDGDAVGMHEEQLYLDDDDYQEEVVEDIPDEILEEQAALMDVADVKEKERQRWKRPDLEDFYLDFDKNNSRDMNVQWLDMDVVSGKPLSKNPNKAKNKVAGSSDGVVPILRTFGVEDRNGHSVCVFLHGFTPYAYFALPPETDVDSSEENMRAIRDALNPLIKAQARGANTNVEVPCLGVMTVRDHKSIMGYSSPHTIFLKVFVAVPGLVPTLKRVMEQGVDLPGIRSTKGDDGTDDNMLSQPFAAFEANVPFVLRFMVDRNLAGAGWLTLPKDTYTIRKSSAKETHCQVRE